MRSPGAQALRARPRTLPFAHMAGVTADMAFLQRAHLFGASTCVKREHGQRPGSVVAVFLQEHRRQSTAGKASPFRACTGGRVELLRSRGFTSPTPRARIQFQKVLTWVSRV